MSLVLRMNSFMLWESGIVTDEDEPKIAAYVTKSNPPHLGTMMELSLLHDKFDKVYVIYYGSGGMLSSNDWISCLDSILSRITDKYEVITMDYDFDNLQSMPLELKELGVSQIITSSNKVLMQCALHKVECQRIRKAPYYEDSFQQLAFGKGMILSSLRKKFGTK